MALPEPKILFQRIPYPGGIMGRDRRGHLLGAFAVFVGDWRAGRVISLEHSQHRRSGHLTTPVCYHKTWHYDQKANGDPIYSDTPSAAFRQDAALLLIELSDVETAPKVDGTT
jgi:hypothetical protein